MPDINVIAGLFDENGRLLHVKDLPVEIAREVALFEIVRVTTRQKGDTTILEETIRVRLRDGATFKSPRSLPVQPWPVTSRRGK